MPGKGLGFQVGMKGVVVDIVRGGQGKGRIMGFKERMQHGPALKLSIDIESMAALQELRVLVYRTGENEEE